MISKITPVKNERFLVVGMFLQKKIEKKKQKRTKMFTCHDEIFVVLGSTGYLQILKL